MPAMNINGKDVVLPNYDFSQKYWPAITDVVSKEIGENEIRNPEQVQTLLKDCFTKMCSILEQKINEQKKASFYIYCQKIHEDSIELWKEQVKGYNLGDIEEDFAASRRVLKILLEQSCKLELEGTPIFYNEIKLNIEPYTKNLEELLYIGSYCYVLSEFITRSQLFGSSIGLKIENGELSILTYQPYTELYSFVFSEIQKPTEEIALSDSMTGFIQLLKDEYKVDYNILGSFINRQLEDPKFKYGLNFMDSIIQEINAEFNYDVDFIDVFYKGLTINKSNCLSIEDCFLKNQHECRHVFRPILELTIDGNMYHMIGRNKWIESFTLLSTNSFPFGLYPSEWKKYKEITKFVREVDNSHDKLLEDPIKKLLVENERKFDYNIESFKQVQGDNVNIVKAIGEIDILFLDEKNKLIYVCECKHNRSRFDLSNWKRDYSNFKDKYEGQLKKKTDWVRENKGVLGNHLKVKYGIKEEFVLNDYDVVGIFIINAPTIYMFNGEYRAFTITDISNLLKGQYTDIKFEFTYEDTGKSFMVEHPYFDNLEKNLQI